MTLKEIIDALDTAYDALMKIDVKTETKVDELSSASVVGLGQDLDEVISRLIDIYEESD